MSVRCAECRRAEAVVQLAWQAACEVRTKPLCDPCARAVSLPHPFTLQPLPAPPPGPRIVDSRPGQ